MACIRCARADKSALCRTCRATLKYDLEQRLAYIATGRPYPLLDRAPNSVVISELISRIEKQVIDTVVKLVEETKASEQTTPEVAPEPFKHVDGICDDCGETIPVKRIQLIPDAKLCAPCQADRGDVFVYRGVGHVAGGQHFGGLVQNIAKSSSDWQKVNVRQLNGKFVESSSDEDV